jgi:hypothetical protein
MALRGCQMDHYNFSTAINGIFWYDPALYQTIYKVLRSPIFNMTNSDAVEAIRKCFCVESEGMLMSHNTHRESVDSYKAYLQDFNYINKENKELTLMASNSLEKHLKNNRKSFETFKRRVA